MAPTVQKFSRKPVTVDAAKYDGKFKTAVTILNWVRRHNGIAFPAVQLLWRPDMGTYWHKDYGFVYLPQGARRPGSTLEPLRDDELVVRTDTGVYALVFPGDYVVRNRSSFYPLAEENFLRSYVSNISRRGTIPVELSPAV